MDIIDRLQELPEELLDQLLSEVHAETEARKKSDPAAVFPWHEIQSWILEAPALCKNPVRIILVAGGNRGGKSKVGMGIWSRVIRRSSPLNRQFTSVHPMTGQIGPKAPTEPLTAWVVPPTLEKARQDWLSPTDQMGLRYWAGDLFVKHRETPDNVLYTRPPDVRAAAAAASLELCDKTIMKSQDQKLESFESSEVDIILVDEELQDQRKFQSMLMRLATTNGVIVMSYTPLHGLTWTYHRFWKKLVKMGLAQKMGERRWIHDPGRGFTVVCAQFGAADNPRARRYAEEIEADPGMSAAEKAARLHGEYGFVEGSLLEALAGIDVVAPDPAHEIYVVDHLPGYPGPDNIRLPGKIVRWLLVTDPNKSYGAVLMAQDQDDNLFLVADHLEEAWPSRKHAEAFKRMMSPWAPGATELYADPGSAGAQAAIEMREYDLWFSPVPKGAGSVAAGVKLLRSRCYVDPNHAHPITGRMGAPKLYFYRPGLLHRSTESGVQVLTCRVAEQLSQLRQTDNENAPVDTPHKSVRSKNDLADCVRYGAFILRARPTITEYDDRRPGPSRENIVLFEDEKEEAVDPLNREFYVHEYDWGLA